MKFRLLSLLSIVFISFILVGCNNNAINFEINFDTNGGSIVESVIYDGSNAITIPDNPTKEGFNFEGWFWDNGTFLIPFTANSLLDTPIEENLIIYAKWMEQDDELTAQLKNIYLLAVQVNAFQGTYEEWLETVRGPQGVPGDDGKPLLLRVNGGVLEWQLEGDSFWTVLYDLNNLVGSDGIDGKNIVLQVAEGYIQWQYTGDTSWTNLVELTTLVGPAGADGVDGIDGKQVTFQVSEGFIQWQYAGDLTWNNLIDLATITGADGTNGTDGVDGKEVVFHVTDGYIQWQYTGDTSWTNLVELATLMGSAGADGTNGTDGKAVLFQVTDGYIQWQYTGDTSWTNLVELATLMGPAGADGTNGTDGIDGLTPYIGENGNWYIGDVDTGVFAGYRDGKITQTGEFIFAVNFDGQSYYLVSYTGKDRLVTIPKDYNGYPVSSIGPNAFLNNSIITSIIIPNTIITIEENAFCGIPNLTNVIFEENSQVNSIGSYAFSEASSLTSIVIPDSVTTIGASAFYGASSLTIMSLPFVGENRMATSISAYFGYIFGKTSYTDSYSANGYYLPNRLSEVIITDATSIEASAFRLASSIMSIVIPDSVTNIGMQAFYGASSLSTVTFEENSQLTNIGNYAFMGASSLIDIYIPDSVTNIGMQAFYGTSSLSTVTFEENSQLTNIGNYAFMGASSLTSIIIPTSVISIGSYVFYDASNLTDIIVATENEYFSSQDGVLFNKDISVIVAYPAGNSRTTYSIPSGVTNINDDAFGFASALTSIIIPSSVTNIEDGAFSDSNNLTNIIVSAENEYFSSQDGVLFDKNISNLLAYPIGNTRITYSIPSGVISIGDYAFYGANILTSIVIPNSVISIGNYAFSYASSLTTVTFEENSQLTIIGYGAFRYASNLYSIVVPDGVSSIGERAFEGASELRSVVIPISVTSMGSYVFQGIVNIKIFAAALTAPTSWNSDWNQTGRPVLWGYIAKVNDGSVEYAFSNDGYAYVVGLLQNPQTTNIIILNEIEGYVVKEIMDIAFYNNNDITSIVVSNSVTSIGDSAFANASNLMSAVIPNSVIVIKSAAFYEANNLTIYAEASSQPSEWNMSWNYSNRPVIWGYDVNLLVG